MTGGFFKSGLLWIHISPLTQLFYGSGARFPDSSLGVS
jgi:hypothetical protein